jgi:MFS family permease
MVGAPGVLLAGVIWLTIREPREDSGGASAATAAEVLPLGQTLRDLFRRRSFVMLTIAVTTCTFPTYSVALWNPAVMMRTFGVPVGEVGLYLGLIAGTASTCGMLLGGYLGQLGGSGPRGLTWPMWGMITAGPLFTLAYFAPTFQVAVALLIVPSVIGGIWYPPLYAALQNTVPPRMRAIAVAVMAFFSSVIGLGLGPTTVGLLSDALQPAFAEDSLRVAVICVANVSLVAALALFLARRVLQNDERTNNAWV